MDLSHKTPNLPFNLIPFAFSLSTLIDEKQLYYDAAEECSKGRVYGLGSLAKMTRKYEDLGASTSREPMVQRSELDAVVQRLVQFEAFVQSQLGMRMDLKQAPFRHHHRHHRRRSIISRWGWIRLVQHKHQHDDDDEDIHDWLDEEHLGDES
ncbi:hypothetical protein Scep_025915 [Stephania cephalantha]|uniref:Uncharacterized protein n=1 Tax=Stephania cephalantha TaxID=152367 RepID=A0AAP0EJ48_9MAGN